MINENYPTRPTLTAAAQPFPEDKRASAVNESASQIADSIYSLRQQRAELDQNIQQAEGRLSQLYSDVLGPKEANKRIG